MEAKEEPVRIQETFSQSTMDSTTLMMEREALLKYIDLSKAEESFKRQKLRVQWLALGDQNNKFFHRKMAANTMRKKKFSIGDGRGNRMEDPIEVKKLIIQFYKDLLGTGFNGRRAAGDIMLHLLQNKVSEGFFSILRHKIEVGLFSFHPKCQSMNLSHVAFADDLFIVCGADASSLTIVKSALEEFHAYSGLQPNLNKSAIFLAGVRPSLQAQLVAILPIPVGYLPVKYLGVPLITSKLSYHDCIQLKERIIARRLCPLAPFFWKSRLARWTCLMEIWKFLTGLARWKSGKFHRFGDAQWSSLGLF
ncbi:hypothetical protein Vadar_028607 [Vaccinium darrowii]|uniref:Uncharacterized protein n=1 Tax=Vaccinium darrowii TaxID=229202 RepID=A0ACB7ZLZ9_9ERIC|nr:hypothetical protein Vadar_028607 [Vaccinium darrowii]